MADCAQIEKKELNVVARYVFGFICNNINPSQNQSISYYPKVVLVGTIVNREYIHMGVIIVEKILMRARQD